MSLGSFASSMRTRMLFCPMSVAWWAGSVKNPVAPEGAWPPKKIQEDWVEAGSRQLGVPSGVVRMEAGADDELNRLAADLFDRRDHLVGNFARARIRPEKRPDRPAWTVMFPPSPTSM